MKKNVLVSFALSVLFVFTSFAQTIPDATGYVNDYARVMSMETINQMDAQLRAYDKQTSIQFVVVTVPTLQESMLNLTLLN